MASTLASLDAASNDRKARLAQLKSLKRKRPEGELQNGTPADDAHDPSTTAADATTAPTGPSYLSGRNYDAATRGPKLGFEHQPTADQITLEQKAAEIADATRQAAEEEAKADRPIDLFKLQPKKPNWDLKRDVERKLERLNVQTDNAIARIVRDRIAAQQNQRSAAASAAGAHGYQSAGGDGEAAAIDGGELLESVHQREREGAGDATESEDDGEEDQE